MPAPPARQRVPDYVPVGPDAARAALDGDGALGLGERIARTITDLGELLEWQLVSALEDGHAPDRELPAGNVVALRVSCVACGESWPCPTERGRRLLEALGADASSEES